MGSVVVDSLFMLLPLFVGVLCFVLAFVVQYFMTFWYCNHLDGEERTGCFTLIVFLMACDC